jgi:hypothetical protein
VQKGIDWEIEVYLEIGVEEKFEKGRKNQVFRYL